MVSKKSRPRRSAEETRQLLVAEGLRQLELVGMDFGVEHITLEAACAETKVPRSSSHAAWAIDDDYTPQAFFQRAVLQAWLASRGGNTFAAAVTVAVAEAAEIHGAALDRNDVVRVAIQAALEAGLPAGEHGEGSGLLSTDMAIKHALASQPAARRDPQIVQWACDSEMRNRTQRIADSYRPIGELLDMEPRAEFGEAAYEHLALAVAALIEGVTMREVVMPDLEVARASIRSPGPTGIPATLLGVCVEALVDKFFTSRSHTSDA